MPLRPSLPIACTSAILALALPAAASAHTDAQVAGGFGQPADPAVVADAAGDQIADVAATSPSDDDGLGTAAVIGLAGGTLLVGAAAGFGGDRLVARRHAVRA